MMFSSATMASSTTKPMDRVRAMVSWTSTTDSRIDRVHLVFLAIEDGRHWFRRPTS